jgi:hypothetical protein
VTSAVRAAQADEISVGQAAEVIPPGEKHGRLNGRVAWIGIAADRHTGKVPLRVRVNNSQGRLRCYVPVKVRFKEQPIISLAKSK